MPIDVGKRMLDRAIQIGKRLEAERERAEKAEAELARMKPVVEAAVAWREKRLTLRPGDVNRDFILLVVDLQNAVEAAKEGK